MTKFRIVPTYNNFALELDGDASIPHCIDIQFYDRQVHHLFNVIDDNAKDFFLSVLTQEQIDEFMDNKVVIPDETKLIKYLKRVMGIDNYKRQISAIKDIIVNFDY